MLGWIDEIDYHKQPGILIFWFLIQLSQTWNILRFDKCLSVTLLLKMKIKHCFYSVGNLFFAINRNKIQFIFKIFVHHFKRIIIHGKILEHWQYILVNVFLVTLILFNYYFNRMSDNRTVKWVTKIYFKYLMADERAWKRGKFVLNLYIT
jgi:hypothetical protein